MRASCILLIDYSFWNLFLSASELTLRSRSEQEVNNVSSNSCDRPQGPTVPPEVSVEEMERLLDRLAEEIVALKDKGYKLVPLFEWLESQIQDRRKLNSALERARERVERIAEKSGTTVRELIRGGSKRKKPNPSGK